MAEFSFVIFPCGAKSNKVLENQPKWKKKLNHCDNKMLFEWQTVHEKMVGLL